MLNSHHAIHSEGEIILTNHNTEKPLKFEQFAFQGYPKLIKAVGLKIFYENPIYEEGLNFILNDPAVKVILLRRKSALAQFVSLKLAEKSKEWVGTLDPLRKINLNIDEFRKFNEIQTKAEHQVLSKLKDRNYFEAYYEDLLQDEDQTLLKLQHFLGVRPKKLVSLLKKQGNKNVSNQIANWDEVKEQITIKD